jgi:hypothetical protein
MAAGVGSAWAARQWYDAVDPVSAEGTVGASVVTVIATSCSGTGRSTGLVVADDRVLTVASAITGPVSVVVITSQRTIRRVVSTAGGADGLAILHVPRLGITPAPLADKPPRGGSELVLLGRTDGGRSQPATVTAGEPPNVNLASYGGPLVDARNEVAGLVAGESRVADPATLRRYAGLVPPVTPLKRGRCAEAKGPPGEVTPVYDGPSTPLAEAARATLNRYVLAVNRHDFKAVRSTYAGRLLEQTSVDDVEKQHYSTYFIDPVIRDVAPFGDSGARARMTFVSIHAEDGPAAKVGRYTCARWNLIYNMARVDGILKIQGTAMVSDVLGCD